MRKIILAPSLLGANPLTLADDIDRLKNNHDWLHLDIMDGHFVPNLTFGAPVIKKLRGATKKPFDVHLMISEPHRYINDFADAGADIISFHTESDSDIDKTLKLIEARGIKPALAIKPGTAPDVVLPYLDRLYMVLVMTVNPGYGGQSLIPSCVKKITQLADIRREKHYDFLISVDGGVNAKTVQSVVDAGADIVVSGSAFFNGSLVWEY